MAGTVKARATVRAGRDAFYRVHACPKPFDTRVDGVEPVPIRTNRFKGPMHAQWHKEAYHEPPIGSWELAAGLSGGTACL